MNNIIKHGAFVVLLAVYALIPANASAALLQHMHTSVDAVTGYWGWGDFQAATASCYGDNGNCIEDVVAFEFGQIVGDNYQANFDMGNIVHVDWGINEITWGIDTFHLTTNWVAATSLAPGTTLNPMTMIEFAANGQTPVAMVTTCFDGTTTCGAQAVTYDLHFSHDVPEPTTLALLSLGLAGLGFTRRKMKV